MPYIREESPSGAVGPLCRNLRTKGMYVAGSMDEAGSTATGGHCWCNETQNVYGPDGRLVERKTCSQDRICYRPTL